MTVQNVACPATIVNTDGSMPPIFIAASNAMPVTMPGSAMGSTNNTVNESFAGNFARASANAASVPRISAMTVAQAATPSDNVSDCQMSARSNARENHLSVNPGGGNW